MLCSNCHERPATFHYTQTVNGRRKQVELCAHCAEHFQEEQGLGAGFGAMGFGEMGLDNLIESVFGPRMRSFGRTNLLDRLSPDSRRILESAAADVAEVGQREVSPEQLLLAFLQDEETGRPMAEQLGLDVDSAIERLEEAIPGGNEGERPERITLSPRLKKALQLAADSALTHGAPTITPDYLLAGLLTEGESLAGRILQTGLPRRAGAAEAPITSAMQEPAKGKQAVGGKNLAKFTRDLNELAKAGKLDPVVGREDEIERVIRILSRRTKNNPVLIGEPGVGKTAIAEGLARLIAQREVPDSLKDKQVLALDLGSLLAGTQHRGEFEERLKGLVDEIRKREGQILLFIDELHTILGAGAAEGAMDAANMLKPMLARGELHAIGATTLDEYRKHIEKDAALERRFQPVLVGEPDTDQAIAILRGLRGAYEAHHRVKITDAAIIAAVDLSERYLMDRFLPDKAIDVLDEAAAMQRLASERGEGLDRLEREIERLEREKEAAVRAENFERADAFKRELEAHRTDLAEARRTRQREAGAVEPMVDYDQIARVVAEWTRIPVQRLMQEERERLMSIEAELHRRVIGQEEAVRAVAEAIRRSRAGMKDPNRPIGSFIFLGPTGVGKTELAKALAEFLFDDEKGLIRFDMSEFQEKHTVSRLVGAPPGYVGYEEAGQLTEAVRRKPYSVLLFDEIEKAHPDLFNILLQILDDGRLTDAKGRVVDFKNTVVIMTSNVGSEHLFDQQKAGLAFGGPAWEQAESRAIDALKTAFRPEFLNRVDETIVFHPLGEPELLEIADLLLVRSAHRLRGQNLYLTFSDEAKAAIARIGFDPAYGARPLRRAIQREIESPLAKYILNGEFEPGAVIVCDHGEAGFVFTSQTAGERTETHAPPKGME